MSTENMRARVSAFAYKILVMLNYSQEGMEAKMETSNRQFEVLKCTFLSQMVIHKASTGHSRRTESRDKQ
jgi:hypothetical protein